MNPRQAQILKLIIDEYIRTAEPVSSKQLCERYNLPCSSATVRNDMAVLEELDLIAQPHTSAGRVPTEKAYRFYIKQGQEQKASQPVQKNIRINITVRRAPRAPTPEERLAQVAHAVAKESGEAVMLATSRPWSTTVGLANLLRKPEFQSGSAILLLAESLERFDAAFKDILNSATDEVTVLLGDENPLGNELASVVVKSDLGNGVEGVLGIVGPLRMDYNRNIALLTQAKKVLEQPLLPL
ncbi:MAG: heat-inducible transcriptional repressor [Patescibacteria group bacterium]|jgi:heat-inducible transcriptional repressor|nr:heat-inducible transcriptional repressor [Patescibacteria group bacterium]